MSRRARFLTPLGWALLTGLALVAAVGAERVAGPGMPDAAGDLLAGLALLAGGLRRGPSGSRSGPLSCWRAWPGCRRPDRRSPVCASRAARAPAAQLPERARRLARGAVVIGAAYVDGLVPELARSEWPTIALMAAVVTVAAWRHRTVGGVERRARAGAGRCRDDWRNARARCVRAPGRRRSGCGRGLDLLRRGGGHGRRPVGRPAVGPLDPCRRHWIGGRSRRPFRAGRARAALARSLGDPNVDVAYRVAGVATGSTRRAGSCGCR